jgi:hypothetical protein
VPLAAVGPCRVAADSASVLIQPNLRFFHELFGWEVELAKAEETLLQSKRDELQRAGQTGGPEWEALQRAEEGKRQIYYTWPSFCRDLVSLSSLPLRSSLAPELTIPALSE